MIEIERKKNKKRLEGPYFIFYFLHHFGGGLHKSEWNGASDLLGRTGTRRFADARPGRQVARAAPEAWLLFARSMIRLDNFWTD
jgi:hypothetical protein